MSTFCCRQVVHAFCARFLFPWPLLLPSSARVLPFCLFVLSPPPALPVCESSLFEWAIGGVVASILENTEVVGRPFRLLNSQPSFLTGGAFEIRTLSDLKIYGRSMFNRPWSGPSSQVRVSNSGLRQGSRLTQGHPNLFTNPGTLTGI